jgi:tripartite-type tricarboxylate transporter receptor subunit TctC
LTASCAGLSGLELDFWIGMLAPAGTPAAVVAKLNSEVNRILAQEDVKSRFTAPGTDIIGGSAQAFGELIRNDVARWGKAIKASGAKPD